MKKLSIISLVLAILFVACNTDEFDFDKLSDKIVWTPEFVAPIATGQFTLWDFVSQTDDIISVDEETDVIKIRYEEEDIVRLAAEDIFELGEVQESFATSFTPGVITLDDINVDATKISLRDLTMNYPPLNGLSALNGQVVPFPSVSSTANGGNYEFSAPDMFRSATFSEGTLTITAQNNLQVPVDIKLELYNLETKLFDFDFIQLAPGQTSSISRNLANKTFSNFLSVRLTEFSTPGSNGTPILIDLDESIALNMRLSNLSISSGEVKIPSQVATTQSTIYDMSFADDVQLTRLNLDNAMLRLAVRSRLQGEINVRITLPSATKDGQPLARTITIPRFEEVTIDWDLAGADFNLASDTENPYNKLPVEYEVSINSGTNYFVFNSEDQITATATLQNLELNYAEGNLGSMEVNIDQDVIDLGVDFWDDIDGGFFLTNPSLQLNVENSFGVDARIEFQATATNTQGQSESLDADAMYVNRPSTQADPAAVTSIIWDKTNSSIDTLISLPPTGDISYSGRVVTNPNSATAINFVSKDSYLSADLIFDLPLELKTSGLSVIDTIDISGGDYDELVSAEMQLVYTNGLPLGMNVELSLLDTISNEVLDVISEGLLQPATVDESGTPTAPTQGTSKIALTEQNIANLKRSNAIEMKILAITPENGAKPAKLLSESGLEIKVGIKAKADFSN